MADHIQLSGWQAWYESKANSSNLYFLFEPFIIFELYSAIGFPKHSKTEYHRRAVQMTLASDDKYELAAGTKGMVMLVFTRHNFDYVYKLIKERFTPPKDTTRQKVRDCYAQTYQHTIGVVLPQVVNFIA